MSIPSGSFARLKHRLKIKARKEEKMTQKQKPSTTLTVIRATRKNDLERPAMIKMTAKAYDHKS